MGELRLGKVTGNSVKNPAGAQSQSTMTRFIQLQSAGGGIREIQMIQEAGDDQCPQPGDRVFLMESGNSRFYVVSSSDKITPSAQPGERELYSYDANATKKARHKLKANGKHYLAANGSDLRTALDSLFTAIDAFSNLTAQGAITTGGSSSVSLAAAIVALQAALNSAASAAKTSVDNILDNAP